jgi:hypothetical protein
MSEDERCFKRQVAAVAFLQERGFKISRSRFNRDFNDGLVPRMAEGFLAVDLLAYAEREISVPVPAAEREKTAFQRDEFRNRKETPAVTVLPEMEACDTGTDIDYSHPPPDMLVGISQGILADGRVVADEARFLLGWLTRSEGCQGIPAVRMLRDRVRGMLLDGALSGDEAAQLAAILRGLVLESGSGLPKDVGRCVCPTPVQTVQQEKYKLIPKEQDLFDNPDELDFSAAFCFTGIFAFGERDDCERETAALGAAIKSAPVCGIPCYVVVGSIANPDWAHGDYGRKIEKAIRYRADGKPVRIIHEEAWAERLVCPRIGSGPSGQSLI